MTDDTTAPQAPRESFPIAEGPMPDGLEQMMVEAHKAPALERRASDDEAQLIALAQAEAAGALPAKDRRTTARPASSEET